jgi:hypothetical protein
VIWIISLAVVAGAGIYATRTPRRAAAFPMLALGNCRAIDLGEGKPGDILTGTFLLGNSGGAPLMFTLTAGCACSQLDPGQGEIQPAEYRPIKVGVRLRSEGRDEHVLVHIETNSPETMHADFWVHASCPARLLVSPQTVDFGPVTIGTSKTMRVHVSRGDKKPFSSISNLKVHGKNEHVKLAQRLTQAGTIEITIGLDSIKAPGWLRTELILEIAEKRSCPAGS